MIIKCNTCQQILDLNGLTYYCLNKNCQASITQGGSMTISVAQDLNVYHLPFTMNETPLYASAYKLKNEIRISKYFTTWDNMKNIILPYFPPNLNDLHQTINRIKLMLIFT